jgi:hypothetical protein
MHLVGRILLIILSVGNKLLKNTISGIKYVILNTMPQLTIKTEHIEKLKKLGVYDKWLENVKARNHTDEVLERMNRYQSFAVLISGSFIWEDTQEGDAFWREISYR